jgi:hypothetical protein
MEAKVESIFIRNPAEPLDFGKTKEEAPLLDGYRFHLSRNILASLTMSKDPSDGMPYALLIGLFIDGEEAAFVTDWLANSEIKRTKEYAFEVPKHPVKLMAPNVTHTAQIKLGKRRVVFGVPVPALPPRSYDLFASDPYFYKIGKLPSE